MDDGTKNIVEIFHEIYPQLTVLGIAGVGGAFFRALFFPEVYWKRRVVQGIGGALAAVFIGGAFAAGINIIVDAGVYAYLAAGFLCGSGGEVAVKKAQEKFFGDTVREDYYSEKGYDYDNTPVGGE